MDQLRCEPGDICTVVLSGKARKNYYMLQLEGMTVQVVAARLVRHAVLWLIKDAPIIVVGERGGTQHIYSIPDAFLEPLPNQMKPAPAATAHVPGTIRVDTGSFSRYLELILEENSRADQNGGWSDSVAILDGIGEKYCDPVLSAMAAKAGA